MRFPFFCENLILSFQPFSTKEYQTPEYDTLLSTTNSTQTNGRQCCGSSRNPCFIGLFYCSCLVEFNKHVSFPRIIRWINRMFKKKWSQLDSLSEPYTHKKCLYRRADFSLEIWSQIRVPGIYKGQRNFPK